MIPAAFDYTKARSLRDALNALAAKDGTKLIAGGHSLLPLLRLRLAEPGRLLDIGAITELRGIDAKGRGIRIGAATTYREVLDSPIVAERHPMLIEAIDTIGDWQVRNRGTLGGSIAHADPASDLPAVLLALDASISLRSKVEKRTVSAKEFFLGAFVTAMREDELVTDIVVPPLPRGAGTAYVTFEQKASGYPLAAAAAVITRSRKTVTYAALALTGVTDHAYLAASAASLVGGPADAGAIQRAAADVTSGIEVGGDIHASVEYRTHLAQVAARRALERALERAR